MSSRTGPSPEDSLHAEQASAEQPARGRLWRNLQLVLVLGMLGGLVFVAKPARIWNELLNTRYLLVLAAVPIIFLTILFDTLRLYCLVRPLGFRGGWRSVLETNLVVNFVSLFLPGTIGGGAVAWWRLSRPDNLRAQIFTALGLNTLLKAVVLSGAGAAALALDARFAVEYRAWIIPLLLIAAVPLTFYLLMLFTPLAAWVRGLHVRYLSQAMPRRFHDALRKILESIELYRSARAEALAALGFGLARLLISVPASLLMLHAVGAPAIDFVRILWIICAIEVAGMVPLSLSGWGLPQVTGVGLLALSGVTSDKSVAVTVLALGASLPINLAGALILLREGTRSRGSSPRSAENRAKSFDRELD